MTGVFLVRGQGTLGTRTNLTIFRHCERSEAIHLATKKAWIASLRSQ
jgi:hypothetical protein